MKLTEAIIERLRKEQVAAHKAKQDQKAKLVSDDGCEQLYLRISKTGICTWVHLQQRALADKSETSGRSKIKRVEKSLGHFPKVAIAEARRRVVMAGGKQRDPTTGTIGEAITRYIDERCGPKALKPLAPKTLHEVKHYLNDVLAPLHQKPLTAFTEDAVGAIVAQKASDTPGAARNLFAKAKKFSKWCASKQSGRLLELDPLASMERRDYLPPEKPREKTLTDAEIKALFAAEGEIARILQFALLTGQRIGEVLQISDDQIEGHWWSIPADVRKVRRAHRVYLSPEARKVYGRDGLYEYSYAAVHRWTSREGAQWRPHDLRRTCSQRLSRAGVAPHIVHACLGHEVGGVLKRTYKIEPPEHEVRDALTLWGQVVAAVCKDQ